MKWVIVITLLATSGGDETTHADAFPQYELTKSQCEEMGPKVTEIFDMAMNLTINIVNPPTTKHYRFHCDLRRK